MQKGSEKAEKSAFLQSVFLRSEKMKKGCPPKKPPWPTQRYELTTVLLFLKISEAFVVLQSKGTAPVAGQS